MGCDIHATIERIHHKYPDWWVNAGDPSIQRNYELFAVLANVRNEDGIPCIAEPRGLPNDVSRIVGEWSDCWSVDGHSHSWLFLSELKRFDPDAHEYFCKCLITARDESGNIVSTARSTSGPHLGPVGTIKVFGVRGRDEWDSLIARMEAAKLPGQSDTEVRLVFWFDS